MKMKKQTIAVDIDDVLTSQNEAMMHFVNRHFGLNHTIEDYNVEGEYWRYWQKVWGVDHEEGFRRWRAFMDNGGLEAQELMPHVFEVTKRLNKRYDFIVVTARQDEFAETTKAWLNKHLPRRFIDVRFVPAFVGDKQVTKAEICLEVGASYLIDDNVEHCSLASEAGIECLLFGNYGWNRTKKLPKRITRVKDWLEVEKYFNARG
jgi:5'(3')-deoxyribonucleotidase